VEKSGRYIPIKRRLGGIIMLKDTRPSEPEDFVEPRQIKIGIPGIGDDEPDAPEPFEFRRL